MRTTAPRKTPLISVIIPTYNCAQTFTIALESVLSQDLEEKEIIIIDGGSNDGTLALLNKYDQQIDYWMSESDNGIYDALNKGISLANGEWLYFLGSDDKLYDNHVFTNILRLRSKSKMIYGNVILGIDGLNGPSGSIYDGEFNKYKLAKRNICHQAIFYHKDLFFKLGNYDEKYPILADFFLNMKAFGSKGTNPIFTNKIIAIYANQGLSNREIDFNFKHDKDSLVRKHLGLNVYLSLLFSRNKLINYFSRLLSSSIHNTKNRVRKIKAIL